MVDGSVIGNWSWRIKLFAWEEEQECDLLDLLNRYSFNGQLSDRWNWMYSKDAVKEGYQQITKEKNSEQSQLEDWAKCVWNKWVPTKINVFVWRLIQDRIPTLPNLKRRNIINQEEADFCRLCEEKEEESIMHLFFNCRFASQIWKLVMDWLDFQLTPDVYVKDQLTKFANSFHEKSKEIWQIFWHGVVWHIWKARNRMIFKGDSPSQREIFEILKFNT